MDLLCYLYDGWRPRIRAADSRRGWMDDAPESFAYRCLPLNIANAHGWEILSPCGFEAVWDGGAGAESVTITLDPDTAPEDAPVTLFGLGTVTFHIAGLFRTPPGWNLWVGGPANRAKDGIAPLGGIIETDWSPYSFTMNWRFTRPHHPVRFEENEPICQIFPVDRNLIETIDPVFRPIDEAPELKQQFEAWSRSRDAFHVRMKEHPPEKPADKWQKLYYRGVDPDGCPGAPDHRAKLNIREFANAPAIPEAKPRAPAPPQPAPAKDQTLARRDWLLATLERQRALSVEASAIYRVAGITAQEFLDRHYAINRPVILCGEMTGWPALAKWSPAWLRERIGNADIEYQGCRTRNPDFELDKDAHKQRSSFAAWLDMIEAGAGNDAYLTAYNSAANVAALAPLADDLGFIDKLLTRDGAFARGMPWIGPAGTFTPLHHDLTNNLLLQIVGRKRVVLAAPGETPKLYNDRAVFSRIGDLESPDFNLTNFPLSAGLGTHSLILEPGEALFIPVGWWHQVRSLDFSISITHTNFIWPNDASESWPG